MDKSKKVCLIAGGAGFIGVNLANILKDQGNNVVIGDNFSLGSLGNIKKYISEDFDDCFEVDLSSYVGVEQLFEFSIAKFGRVDEVWHLAANSDIPAGVNDPNVDHKDTFLTTFELLKGCRHYSVRKFNFASSSAVYGDWGAHPLSENLGPLKPISNYGAMKLASEAQISAACESFLDSACIFRFPNVVGTPATHGVILDFVRKLVETPNCLHVLGNGSQKKSYLHVSELVDAMIHVSNQIGMKNTTEIVNIGCDDGGILVSEIAKIVVELVAPNAEIRFGQGEKGWVGDVPKFSYDVSRLKAHGWAPAKSSYEAVYLAAQEISSNLTDSLI